MNRRNAQNMHAEFCKFLRQQLLKVGERLSFRSEDSCDMVPHCEPCSNVRLHFHCWRDTILI